MTSDARMPYGAAKRTIANLSIGSPIFVRPEYRVTYHNAARRMGMRLASVAVQTNDGLMFRMVRVADGVSGHQACRLPRRSHTTGRWLRSKLLTAVTHRHTPSAHERSASTFRSEPCVLSRAT